MTKYETTGHGHPLVIRWRVVGGGGVEEIRGRRLDVDNPGRRDEGSEGQGEVDNGVDIENVMPGSKERRCFP